LGQQLIPFSGDESLKIGLQQRIADFNQIANEKKLVKADIPAFPSPGKSSKILFESNLFILFFSSIHSSMPGHP